MKRMLHPYWQTEKKTEKVRQKENKQKNNRKTEILWSLYIDIQKTKTDIYTNRQTNTKPNILE